MTVISAIAINDMGGGNRASLSPAAHGLLAVLQNPLSNLHAEPVGDILIFAENR